MTKTIKSTVQTAKPVQVSKGIAPRLDNTYYSPNRQLKADGDNDPHIIIASLAQIYAIYDALVTADPTYITKTTLGNDQSDTYPIYKYEFVPSDPVCKIILGAGIHWEYAEHIISLANFMKQICTKWTSNPVLNFLRWKVHIVVMPIQNPYGLVNQIRHNSNLVDLNRNFDYKWADYTPPSDYFKKGTAPFSEKETQYIRDVLAENTDAICYLAQHMEVYAGQEFRYFLALGTGSSVSGVAREVIDYLSVRYPPADVEAIEEIEWPQAYNYAEKVLGIPSADIESQNNATTPDVGSFHMTRELGWRGNMIWGMIKNALSAEDLNININKYEVKAVK